MTDTCRYVLSVAMLAVLVHLSEARPSADQMAEYRVPWVDDGQLTAQDEIYIGKLIEGLKGLNRLERYGMQNKRGLDFGLGRGFSGSQAAKHLMGMASANFAGGPGRKRRSPAAQQN